MIRFRAPQSRTLPAATIILLAAGLSALALFASCAAAPAPRQTEASSGTTKKKAASASRKTQPERAVPGSELDGPAFAELPAEARSYLKALSEAFGSGDAERILSQGEPSYEARNRPRLEAGQYAALLYRVGPYSAEGPDRSDRIPRLDAASVASLRYAGWTDRGPVAEVRGQIGFRDGTAAPCTIYLLWKALPPRILGREP
jgi:hypothetical protein